MATVGDVWLLCRSLRSASLRSRWQFVNLLCFRIAFFFTLYEVFACRITVYWKNGALHCNFDRRKPLLPQWRNLSYRYVFLRICFFNGFIFLMATVRDAWLLCRSLRSGRDDNLWIYFVLGLLSFLLYTRFLLVGLRFIEKMVHFIAISTGGSLCFRSGEIFLIDMCLSFFFTLIV